MQLSSVTQNNSYFILVFYLIQPLVFIMAFTSAFITLVTLFELNKELRYFNQKIKQRILIHHTLIFLISIFIMVFAASVFVYYKTM